MLPSFLVIGAQKSGTTSLHVCMSKCKLLCLPKGKETDFFSDPARFGKGVEYYKAYFAHRSPGQLLGEVDPLYLYSTEAPQRVKNLLGSIKLVVLFRNPIDRAYSQYWHAVRRGYETLPFETAIRLENERIGKDLFSWKYFSYLSPGQYFKQVSNWLKFFDLKQFHFILYEDLVADTQQVLNGLAEFLDLPMGVLRAGHFTNENPARRPRFDTLKRILYPPEGGTLQRVMRALVPIRWVRTNIRNGMLRWGYKPFRPPPMSEELRKHLYDYFEEDMAQLGRLAGLNLDCWRDRENQSVNAGHDL